jgi:carbonic anhydrase
MYWLLGRKSQLSLSNKLLLYKTILKPILERFQSKALRMILDAPWYVPNTLIRRDFQIPSVKEEISHYSSHYSARLTAHLNVILLTLLEPPERKRLRRHLPNDLPARFMV